VAPFAAPLLDAKREIAGLRTLPQLSDELVALVQANPPDASALGQKCPKVNEAGQESPRRGRWRRTMSGLAALVVTMFVLTIPVLAVQPDEMLEDSALEARARALSQELRCMVCQNQSIDDSDAPLARDLRILVRERLSAGDSDNQVIDFLVARYGEFVLLKPRLAWRTALLWLAPFAVVLIGAIGFLVAARRARAPATAPLSAEEAARVAALVERD
jgi:cytochrome c-type biogenesis protein CcmH